MKLSTLTVTFLSIIASFGAMSQPQVYTAKNKDGELISYQEFILSYAEEHEQPWWVAYCLTSEELSLPPRERISFRSDSNVLSGSAVDADYTGSGYDRGHLSRAEYNKQNATAYKQCFYLTNISPQLGVNFNRTGGDWYNLEELEKQIAYGLDSLFGISGPIFEDNLGTIGKSNTITVPGYFYKAMLSPDLQHSIAFIVRHDQEDDPSLWEDVVSIDSLEAFSGLDIFPELPDSLEDKVEADFTLSFWQQAAKAGKR